MLRLLTLEWKKFKNNSVISLFALMFLITMPVTILMYDQFEKLPPPLPQKADIFSFPGIWEYQAYVGSWLVFFFLGFVMMYIITSEVNFKTMRQNIITGLTRKEFFMSKIGVMIVLAIISTIIYIITCLLYGYFYTEPHSFEGAFADGSMLFIFKYFLMNLGYMSFGLMIALLIRNSGIAIFFYVSYIIFIEMMLKWMVHKELVADTSLEHTMNYWPLNAIEDLTPNPFYKLGGGSSGQEIIPLLTDNQAIIASSIFIMAFLGISYWSFMKRDI